jgi:hypothetical protein
VTDGAAHDVVVHGRRSQRGKIGRTIWGQHGPLPGFLAEMVPT